MFVVHQSELRESLRWENTLLVSSDDFYFNNSILELVAQSRHGIYFQSAAINSKTVGTEIVIPLQK